MAKAEAPFQVGQIVWQAMVYVRERPVDDSHTDFFSTEEEAERAGQDAADGFDPEWQKKPGNADLVCCHVTKWVVTEVEEDGTIGSMEGI